MKYTYKTKDGATWVIEFHFCYYREFPYSVWVKGKSNKKTRLLVLGKVK